MGRVNNNNKLKIITYSKSIKSLFYVKYSDGIGILVMFLVILLERIMNERTVWNMILFFLAFMYIGIMLYFKKYDSSFSFDLKLEEVQLRVYFRSVHKFKLTDLTLSVEESVKSNDMEYCISTPKGKFYIPKNNIFNSSRKFVSIVELLDSYKLNNN
jgi:hypothetical protein